MEYQVLKSSQGDFFVSTAKVVGFDEVTNSKPPSSNLSRWNQPVKVKTVIYNAVKAITKGTNDIHFTPSEVIKEVLKETPQMNINTIRCQLIQDCVNHTSRKHYPSGQQDYYFLISKGKYRLHNTETDGKWNWRGEKID